MRIAEAQLREIIRNEFVRSTPSNFMTADVGIVSTLVREMALHDSLLVESTSWHPVPQVRQSRRKRIAPSARMAESQLLARSFPSHNPTLLAELTTYEHTGIISEDVKEKAKDAVQYLIGAAVEYGITVPSLGTGAPVGAIAETIVDAVFTVESVASAVAAINNVAKEAGEFSDILNQAMAAKDKIASSLDDFYNDVSEVLRAGLVKLGKNSQEKMKELAEALSDVVKKMTTKIADAIGDAFKLLIPEATIGLVVGELVQAGLESAAENSFNVAKEALAKLGKYGSMVTDPSKAVSFFSDAMDKIIEFMKETATKLEDRSLLTAIVTGGAAGALVKTLGPPGLEKIADLMEQKKGEILALVEKIVNVVIPATFTLLALNQILLKGEFMPKEDAADKSESLVRSLVRDMLNESFTRESASADHLLSHRAYRRR